MENIPVADSSEDREKAMKLAAEEFGQRVKQLRKDAGLTQKDLADRLARWGRSYHQTTVAKLEAGTRPTTLEELIPLAVALGVSQREFFQDPSPTERAEHKVREAEQELLSLRSEMVATHARYLRLRDELSKAVGIYSRRVDALAVLDADAAAERRQVVEDLNSMVDELEEWSDVPEAGRAPDAESDTGPAEKSRSDQWPA